MKYKLLLYILIAFFIHGCMSSDKALRNGYYDTAIAKAAKKLRKNPSKQNQIAVLEEAFKKAQQIDLERIAFIQKEGQPSQWDEVHAIYSRIKNRQEIVKRLPTLRADHAINFNYINVDDELIQSKQKAAEYFYANGVSLLQQGGKMNARNAFSEFEKIKGYYSNFKDVDIQLAKAHEAGMTNILFAMKKADYITLPPAFEQELMKISVQDLNQQWIRYFTTDTKEVSYDYTVYTNIKQIEVSPERSNSKQYSESKKIQDGWEYEVDSKGNVKKDSLGNDIKKPKYKTISCTVVETFLTKSVRVAGSLDYVNNQTKQLYKTDNLAADSFFEDGFVTVVGGDVSALTPATKNKIGKHPLPFPPTPDMILQAGGILKGMVKNILHDNKCILN